jgi:hypothetical protein
MIVMGRGNYSQISPAIPPGAMMQLASSHGLHDHAARGRGMNHGMGADAIMERVLIIDDHPLVRDGLRSVIAISFDSCEIFEAASLEEAIGLLEKHEVVPLSWTGLRRS